MKNLFFIIILILGFSCKENKIEPKKENQKKINQIGSKYFDFDELIHYHHSLAENNTRTLFENQKKSEIDSLKFGVILNQIPNSIKDTIFIEKLKRIGYSERKINKKDFDAISQIFTEKTHAESVYAACVYVYRDVLIFKKKSKIVGIAKICFGCGGSIIYGTKSNTEEFGQSGDYEKLNKILNNK